MSDTSNKIIGAGLVDEGIYLEKLEKEIQDLKNKIESKKLICPHCLCELRPFNYQGYYDSFSGWGCDCEKFDKAEEWQGNYT